ncbi:MAG: tetratricopeptide repeat protein, partial [Flavobacterium sp.]
MPSNRFVFVLLLFLLSISNASAINQKEDFSKLILQSKQANDYFRNKDFEKSLLLAREVLKKALKTDNDYLISITYNTIGCNYSQFSEYDKAIDYFNKSLFFAKKSANDTLQFKALNNLGNVYCFNKKNFQKGIPFFKKAIYFCKKIKNENFQLFVSINIAWAYFENGNFEEGLEFFNYANTHFIEKGNESICTIYEMINGMYFNQLKNYE